jgi:GNAT superfamily N-acetyltransferase
MAVQIELQTKRLRQLTEEGHHDLPCFTIGRDSCMAAVVEDNPPTAQCRFGRVKRRMVGWSLLRWFEPQVRAAHNAYLSVYVGASDRGNGIGRQLVRAAMAHSQSHNLQPCSCGTQLYELGGFGG